MGLKKLSKKIMAYTLTTAMMTGFFAVSNINLTTAWAAVIAASNNVYTLTANDNTITGIELGADTTIITGNSTNAAEIATSALTIPAGKILHIKTAAGEADVCTITAGSDAVTLGVGTKINKSGISDGTVTNGTITGGTLSDVTLSHETNGKVVIKNCKVAAGNGIKLTATADKTVTVEGSLEGLVNDSYVGTLEGTGTFNFDNATVSGNLVGDDTAVPIVKGNIKASGLTLGGKVDVGSNAVITLKDGVNVLDATTAANNFSKLTLVRGANFSGTTCKATIKIADVSSASAKLFKYSSADEANFVDGMLKGNIVATSTHGGASPDQLDANGYGAHLQGGYLTYGLYDFDYAKSGQKVDVTCVAKGNKYDGTKFSVNVKPEVEVGIADIDAQTGTGACTGEFSEVLLSLSDEAKSVKTNKTGLWAAFQASCKSIACSLQGTGDHSSATPPAVDGGYTVKFYREVSGVADTVDVNLGGTIVKKNISNAVVNGLHANGIDTYNTNNTAATAALLPDGFASIELGANIASTTFTAGTQTAFTSGTLNSTSSGTPNVYLVYKTEDGKLVYANLDAVKGSALTWNTTSGNHTQSVVATSDNYTGSVSVPYEIVDAIVDGVTYNGNARPASVSGAQSYSVNGTTWTTDAPTFTDAGTYTFNYKLSDGVAKTATFTIKPATVTPVWNINSTGNAISYDYDGKAKTRSVVGVSGDSSLSQSILDKFDTSAIAYKYYYDSDASLSASAKEVKECIDATETGKCYYVVPVADRKVNKNEASGYFVGKIPACGYN